VAKPKSFRASDIARAITIIRNSGYRITQIEITLAGNVSIRVVPDAAVMSGEGCEPEIQIDNPSEADLDRELAEWKALHGH
jgi:hypothetical protein